MVFCDGFPNLNASSPLAAPAMPRSVLDEAHIHAAIRRKIDTHHADIVREVQAAITSNDVVVVGMAQNPHPKEGAQGA